MKLPNIWSYGQLFGYSALDGSNRYYHDFIGTLTSEKIAIRFELDTPVVIKFPVEDKKVDFHAVTGDMIDCTIDGTPFFMTFADNDTLVGYTPVLPVFIEEKELIKTKSWNVDVWRIGCDYFGMLTEETENGYKFCIHHSFSEVEARSGVNRYIQSDIESLKAQRYAYFESLPKCKDERYEQLYYKTLSVQKVNVKTAEGKIPCTWTTPDRVPHRHMWLWDSVFHALAMVNYNHALAQSAIDAVMSQQREDGFIPHMMNPTDSSDVTQPQVIAWGVWEVYKQTKDKAFLQRNADKLARYLAWDMENRDKNKNGLLEWFTEPEDILCKCGECGQDDSPRFDADEELDAIDFSVFACHDAKYLSYIYGEIGDNENAKKWSDISSDLKDKINELLWDEEDGVYYDKLVSGKFHKVLTPSSLFPLFAGIASKEQAERMVKVLTDETLFWTEAPIPSVAKNHPTFSNGMWRGGVWLNVNYFMFMGLKKYGYAKEAQELRERTLNMVAKWYKVTGTVSEFYDPLNETAPYHCDRKGTPPEIPDWRKHVHSITDFHWSSCFTMLFIQNIIYGGEK